MNLHGLRLCLNERERALSPPPLKRKVRGGLLVRKAYQIRTYLLVRFGCELGAFRMLPWTFALKRTFG